ncbi:hypothetical protein ACQPXB_23265 [Amycolatopsis sp. CA-161197]|uniref:hypothetical protein n=1 Tax=Amycolatopsis sp. CA-161197 TaxID=3239922 RepID=UPI003D8DD623
MTTATGLGLRTGAVTSALAELFTQPAEHGGLAFVRAGSRDWDEGDLCLAIEQVAGHASRSAGSPGAPAGLPPNPALPAASEAPIITKRLRVCGLDVMSGDVVLG